MQRFWWTSHLHPANETREQTNTFHEFDPHRETDQVPPRGEGWMNGLRRKDRWMMMDGLTAGWMDEWTDDRGMDEQIEGWLDGQMTEGKKDG